MFNVLTGLALGIVVFAITIGVGVIVLQEFGDAVSSCATSYSYNVSTQLCQEDANLSNTASPSSATQTTNSLNTELGTSGLAGWTAAIIALSVGLLFIGALMGKGKK